MTEHQQHNDGDGLLGLVPAAVDCKIHPILKNTILYDQYGRRILFVRRRGVDADSEILENLSLDKEDKKAGDDINKAIDHEYESFEIMNKIKTSPDSKTFHWLIKPGDRVRFEMGHFEGEYYDNGLLILRYGEPYCSPSAFESNKQLLHSVHLHAFNRNIEENNLFLGQNRATSADNTFELADQIMTPLLEQFMCRVCLDVCLGGVYMCANKHFVCGPCRDAVKRVAGEIESIVRCPTCRAPSQFRHPQMVMTQVVGEFPFFCRSKELGCPEFLNGNDILHHFAEKCNYRPWRCYYCPEITQIRTISTHLVKEHKEEIMLMDKSPEFPASFEFEVPINVLPTYERTYRREYREDINRNKNPIKAGILYVKNVCPFILLELELSPSNYAWVVCCTTAKENIEAFKVDMTLTITYDLGRGRDEVVTTEFKNQPIFSCQYEMRDLLKQIQKTRFTKEYGMAIKNFSRHGGAGRYFATMCLQINQV